MTWDPMLYGMCSAHKEIHLKKESCIKWEVCKIQEQPSEKDTSPAAGPVNSAGVTSPPGGTGQGPVGQCKVHNTKEVDQGLHLERGPCKDWRPWPKGLRTAVHEEGANSKQVGGEHYKLKIQIWDFIVGNEIPFLEGSAIKYIVRHKAKGGKLDLEKAIHYLQKALEVYYPEKKS